MPTLRVSGSGCDSCMPALSGTESELADAPFPEHDTAETLIIAAIIVAAKISAALRMDRDAGVYVSRSILKCSFRADDGELVLRSFLHTSYHLGFDTEAFRNGYHAFSILRLDVYLQTVAHVEYLVHF